MYTYYFKSFIQNNFLQSVLGGTISKMFSLTMKKDGERHLRPFTLEAPDLN